MEPQRPKGANVKQVLKVMLVLAVCAWMLYQLKNSRNNNTDTYGDQTKFVLGYGAIPFGQKWVPSRLDERPLPDSGNADSVGEAKESSSGRDDDVSEGKEVKLELEIQPKVSSKKKNTDSSKRKSAKVYAESRRSEPGHSSKKYPNRPAIDGHKVSDTGKEVQSRELPNDVQVRKNAKLNFSAEENVEEKETRMQKNVLESVTDAGLTEEINGVKSFSDENGVPPDGNEMHFLHEENIADIRMGSWLEMNLVGLKIDEETNTGTIVYVDTSGIIRNQEMDERESLVV